MSAGFASCCSVAMPLDILVGRYYLTASYEDALARSSAISMNVSYAEVVSAPRPCPAVAAQSGRELTVRTNPTELQTLPAKHAVAELRLLRMSQQPCSVHA